MISEFSFIPMDAAWDVIAEQNQGAGYSIQQILCDKLVLEAKSIALDDLAGANSVVIASETAITWLEFLAVVGAVDKAHTGPADYVLCSPARYWQLLALDQFVNSLYAGSDEVMRSGVAKTTLGVTVLRVSGLGDAVSLKFSTENPDFALGEVVTGAGGASGTIVALSRTAATAGTMTLSGVTGTFVDTEALTGSVAGVGVVVGTQYAAKSIMALNSKKAFALAYRRDLSLEPYEYPEQDKYGFIGSVRAKADTIVPSAVSVGMVGVFIEHL